MPAKNGLADKIPAYVAAHPGCNRAELSARFQLTPNSSILTYVKNIGRIFAAGPRYWQRYYPTAEQAAAADATVHAEARVITAERAKTSDRKGNLRRRAKRAANGGRLMNTRPGAGVDLAPDVTIAPKARLVVYQSPLRLRQAIQAAAGVPRVVDASQAREWAMLAYG